MFTILCLFLSISIVTINLILSREDFTALLIIQQRVKEINNDNQNPSMKIHISFIRKRKRNEECLQNVFHQNFDITITWRA